MSDFDGLGGGGKAGSLDPILRFPFLRFVWFCGDFAGGDRRRAAGVLLSDCTVDGAMLYAKWIGLRQAIGWMMGTLVSALSAYLSLKIDCQLG
ncbi:MAG TPA: hypothetical protein VEU96_33460 [Bryobacteraceae bacterium]|nr:hypothetical protein [Bryobacteraceae bacterium]